MTDVSEELTASIIRAVSFIVSNISSLFLSQTQHDFMFLKCMDEWTEKSMVGCECGLID
jgi:hypothetical protein